MRRTITKPKHPFKVLFKGDYGQSSLHYQMFPDSPVDQFDQINLRAGSITVNTGTVPTGAGPARRTRG
jgi:hypothetical protein